MGQLATTARQCSVLLAFDGCFTTGSAGGDTKVFDNIWTGQLTPTPKGRQMVPYYLSGRDQAFVFDHGQTSQTAYSFAEVGYNMDDFIDDFIPDIIFDVDIVRWGYAGAAIIYELHTEESCRALLQRQQVAGIVHNGIKLRPKAEIVAFPEDLKPYNDSKDEGL